MIEQVRKLPLRASIFQLRDYMKNPLHTPTFLSNAGVSPADGISEYIAFSPGNPANQRPDGTNCSMRTKSFEVAISRHNYDASSEERSDRQPSSPASIYDKK
jgi:hypothetical protein